MSLLRQPARFSSSICLVHLGLVSWIVAVIKPDFDDWTEHNRVVQIGKIQAFADILVPLALLVSEVTFLKRFPSVYCHG